MKVPPARRPRAFPRVARTSYVISRGPGGGVCEGASEQAMQRSSGTAVEIPPYFRVVSPSSAPRADGVSIVLCAGGAFGDGRHETTQLCVQAVAAFAPRPVRPWRLLDFGSGSGILHRGGEARRGRARRRDRCGLHRARRRERTAQRPRWERLVRPRRSRARAERSTSSSRTSFVTCSSTRQTISSPGSPPTGTLVLSGLVSTDVPEVSARYAKLLGDRRAEIYERGDWRALVWRGDRRASS